MAAKPERTILIRNVTAITMTDAAPSPVTGVLIRGGRIASLVPAGSPLPKADEIIDGVGGFLIPGLIDAHVHYPYGGLAKPANYLRYGVTTVFSLGTPEPEVPALLAARDEISRGRLAGPHIYATGPSIANQVRLERPEQVEPFLDLLAANKLELVKVYNEIPQPVFDAVVAGARRRGMGVFGHMPRNFPPQYSLTHGLNVLAHMEELFFTTFGGPRDRDLGKLAPDWIPDYGKIDATLDLFVANQVAIIPNLSASLNFQNLWADEDREFSTSDMRYVRPDRLAEWRRTNGARRPQMEKRMVREQIKYPLIRALTYRAAEKGILLLAGSDAPLAALFPGRSLHQELRMLVAAGLSNEQALRTATSNGGMATRKWLDRTACIGVIKTGCEADLVLLSGNPLDDIRNAAAITGVMTNGRWYTSAQLETLSRPD
jgi:cytosine/adenosine deaminase-related metal-dependent hydrolase